jgi:hypothetical protein
MPQRLLDLHQLAAQAQVFNTQYLAGVLTEVEYKDKIQHLYAHNDIQTAEHHKEVADVYREIIDGALRVVEGK